MVDKICYEICGEALFRAQDDRTSFVVHPTDFAITVVKIMVMKWL